MLEVITGVFNPAWEMIKCNCSNGLKTGGEEPIECDRCEGNGVVWRHKKSGLVKNYPGGRIVGK